MISRKASILIARGYTSKFSFTPSVSRFDKPQVYRDSLYDFLYERDYEPWFCNMVKRIASVRDLTEWMMKIHTGESLASATEGWSWENRRKLGQTHLKSLARDFIVWYRVTPHTFERPEYKRLHDELIGQLELDGYLFSDNELYLQEGDILDVESERGLLEKLYASLGLKQSKEAFEFIGLSEGHYLEGRWSDCIGNSRKFFELTLTQVAIRHSGANQIVIPDKQLERPVEIRTYLETNGLLEKKEREAIDKIYGLLSHTGAHPYMAEKDQARLLRQIALTTSQFVLLRLEGSLR